MHPCEYFTHLWHFAFGLALFQWFFGILGHPVQGESKKTDTFDIQMNNKGVSFF